MKLWVICFHRYGIMKLEIMKEHWKVTLILCKTLHLIIQENGLVCSFHCILNAWVHSWALWSRACLDHHLIAIRSPEIQGDHERSGTSLIAITLHCWFQSSAKLTFSNCDWMQQCFGTLHGREDGSCRSISSRLCLVRGDQGVPECVAQRWAVAGNRNWGISCYQTDCSAVAAMPN